MFCAKLVDLCKTCKVNTVEPLQEVMFDPSKHATFESEGSEKASFTFRVKMAGADGLALEEIVLFVGIEGVAICDPTVSACTHCRCHRVARG